MRPLFVLVSGVPGGGKTTLARRLADHLGLPHISRDAIRDGLWFTDQERQRRDLNDDAWALFLTLVASWLDAGVSLVVDQTLYRGSSEEDFLPLVNRGSSVNVLVRTTAARERFHRKMASDPRNDDAAVSELMDRWDEIVGLVSEPLPLGCPVVEVDTTGAVDLVAVAERVLAATGRRS